ncbi:hypothetical protein YTPLAS18_28110 [Nitrospira sp.]|nr:hypothetical protein YTPLAS18_28110 [Nitrospira sp.]
MTHSCTRSWLVGVMLSGFTVAGSMLLMCAPARAEHTQGVMTAMYWIQPAIGEAIVEQARLERDLTGAMGGAVTDLNRTLAKQAEMARRPMAWLDVVREASARDDANHAARVQYVLGRAIVNGTQRGIHAGFVPLATKTHGYTRRLVAQAHGWGASMDEAYFAAREANLGAAIVEASRGWMASSGRVQERLGRVIGTIATTQSTYGHALTRNREQMTALMGAATRTEARADLFAHLMSLDPAPLPPVYASVGRTSMSFRPDPSTVALWSVLLGFTAFFSLFLSVGRMGRTAI